MIDQYRKLQALAKNDIINISETLREITGSGIEEYREVYSDQEKNNLYYSYVITYPDKSKEYQCFLCWGSIPVTDEEIDKSIF